MRPLLDAMRNRGNSTYQADGTCILSTARRPIWVLAPNCSSAVRGRLHELDGDLPAAATAYAEAARRAPPPPPPRHAPGPPAAPRTSPSATTWSAGPPALGPAELQEGRLTERPPPGQRHPRTTTRSSTNRREEGHEPARDHRRAAGS